MELPSQLIASLRGLDGFDEESFKSVHKTQEAITSIRLNPLKIGAGEELFPSGDLIKTPVPWCANGYYLNKRPSFTFDPLFHAGCYYVQEASSMFLEEVLRQYVNLSESIKVLDLCAAPGGKSTHLQSLISRDSLLVSNEVIKSRAAILKENIIKWGCSNVVVTHNDPKEFSKLTGFFDIIVVDAPCSGSGLFRRDEDAIEEWSENNVTLCSQRQQRILADIVPALKENGVLIYSTCSYSEEENESIVQWLTTQFELKSISEKTGSDWGIITVNKNPASGYRFWPHLVKGEGFFMVAFRKTISDHKVVKMKSGIKALPNVIHKSLQHWFDTKEHRLVQFGANVYAWPEALFENFDFLARQLRVIYSGTLLGELIREKLIPEHALAMSPDAATAIYKTELDLPNAIRYLQKNEIKIHPAERGWQLACYHNHPLGWMNVLANRINNYYPKELRILKN